jgi:DNA-binding transcriptional regulator YiaG
VTGSEVRQIRKALGMSQPEFAELVGVHAIAVSKWETGAMGIRPTTGKLIRLLTASKRNRKKSR